MCISSVIPYCSMKEELTSDKLKGVKLWITAGPREKFTASEVMK